MAKDIDDELKKAAKIYVNQLENTKLNICLILLTLFSIGLALYNPEVPNINGILILITSVTINELRKDINRMKKK